MNDGTNVKQRDIVLVPFPYSDLSKSKRRPAIIISNSKYNRNNDDMICCAITSSKKQLEKGIKIDNSDLEYGNLRYESAIIPGKIFTILQRRIVKTLGKLKIEKSKELVKRLNYNMEIEEQAK